MSFDCCSIAHARHSGLPLFCQSINTICTLLPSPPQSGVVPGVGVRVRDGTVHVCERSDWRNDLHAGETFLTEQHEDIPHLITL